jgi:hypothetical protein
VSAGDDDFPFAGLGLERGEEAEGGEMAAGHDVIIETVPYYCASESGFSASRSRSDKRNRPNTAYFFAAGFRGVEIIRGGCCPKG